MIWKRITLSLMLVFLLLGLLAAATAGAAARAPETVAAAPISAAQEVFTATFQQGVGGYMDCTDARISEERPNDNMGDQQLVLGMRGRVSTLVRFDVSSLPPDATIISAELGLYVYNYGQRPPDPSDRAIVLPFLLLRPWEEMETTWLRATAAELWGLPGGNQAGVDRSGMPLQTSHPGLYERDTWYVWDVTSAVQGWVDEPDDNHGVILQQVNPEVGGEYDTICSECAEVEERPYLRVVYTLAPPVTSLAVTKEPASTQVTVGDTLSFTLTVQNTGETTITQAVVTDTFDPSFLAYESSTVAPDVQAPGMLTWNALGAFLPLAPGEQFEIGVQFTALAPTEGTVNTVTAEGCAEPGQCAPPDEDTSTVTITPEAATPQIEVVKLPPSTTVGISETVTFTLRVSNVGAVTVTSLTLTDEYDPAFLMFLSADVMPDAAASGVLTWTNPTGLLPLAPGESFDIETAFMALAETEATVNTVTAEGCAESGECAPPDEDTSTVTITPEEQIYRMFLPKMMVNAGCMEQSYCSTPGADTMIYRINGDQFQGYTCITGPILHANECPLIEVPTPPAPMDWNQVSFVPGAGWVPAAEVSFPAWEEAFEVTPPGQSWLPRPPTGATILGLETAPGESLGVDEVTQLLVRTFTLTPPQPGLVVRSASLEMWSDNKTFWWWQGVPLTQGWQGRVTLDITSHVAPEGGTYRLAIQNSNDRVAQVNPQGTAYCLRVTWCTPGFMGF